MIRPATWSYRLHIDHGHAHDLPSSTDIKGLGCISGKDLCTLLGTLVKGFTTRRSAITIPSSAAVLWLWEEDWVSLCIWTSKFSAILSSPPEERLDLSIASSVLFAPIALIDFFSDLFLFSWSRSISMLFLAPPLQLTVDAQMHWLASASD